MGYFVAKREPNRIYSAMYSNQVWMNQLLQALDDSWVFERNSPGRSAMSLVVRNIKSHSIGMAIFICQ